MPFRFPSFKPKPLTAIKPKIRTPVVKASGKALSSMTSMMPMAGMALVSGLPAIANLFAINTAADVIGNIAENPIALGAIVLVALAVLLR